MTKIRIAEIGNGRGTTTSEKKKRSVQLSDEKN
jgi:hypothetical protein